MVKSNKAHPRLTSRLGALSLLTIALIFGTSAAPATAAVPQSWWSSHSTADYVALGDSFTSGQGAPPYYYSDPPCLQSKYASYPVITAALTKHKLAANKSCSSATAALVQGQVQSLALDGVDMNAINLVTLTVGGIDAGSNEVFAACAVDTTPTGPCGAAIQAGIVALPGVGQALLETYLTVAASMPNAKVVVLTYPQLFKPGLLPLGEIVNGATVALNATITQAAMAAHAVNSHVQLVDVTNEFANHGIGARLPYISFNPADLGAQANFHPNALGNSLGYFRALLKAGVLG